MFTRAQAVSLNDILDAREARALRQQEFLREYPSPLISFTLNLPGEYKRSPLSDLLFYDTRQKLKEKLGEPKAELLWDSFTGLELLLSYDLPAAEIKACCEELEESLPGGRLLDLDVLDRDGKKESRNIPRTCFLCGKPAAECGRSRSHGLDALKAKTEELLLKAAPVILGEYAVRALLWEVNLTPKPGLVDRADNGAHQDLTPALFEKSAKCLRPYFEKAAVLGCESPDCMAALQNAGLEAEKEMFSVTGGVNTHKGAIYAFGIALAAAGSCLVREDNLFRRASALAKAGKKTPENTHGAAVRSRHPGGARAEAEAGFPSAQIGLKTLENGDGICALMQILLSCEDTNLLWRGGEEGLLLTREYAKKVLEADSAFRPALLDEMNRVMIGKKLSPGGSADMLALAKFLHSLKGVVL